MIGAIVLDRGGGLVTAGTSTAQTARLGANLMIVSNLLRLWNVSREPLDRVRQEVQQRAGPTLSEARVQRGPANFADTLSEALLFPVGVTDPEQAKLQVRDAVQKYFEETWIHRTLKSLDQVPPIDAVGHPTLRKKLIGVVQFLQDC